MSLPCEQDRVSLAALFVSNFGERRMFKVVSSCENVVCSTVDKKLTINVTLLKFTVAYR